MKKRIICTVTNDLTYDQRMIRICTSLSRAGYEVCLVGRKLKESKPFADRPFEQKRLNCFFRKGKFFYIAYNIRLFFFLLFSRFDAVCSIDLDSLLAGYYLSRLRRKICIYDAHEYFTQVPEVVQRPRIQRIWEWVARRTIPNLKHCYTVCESLAKIFKNQYGTDFEVIRNVPFRRSEAEQIAVEKTTENLVMLYQGVLNDGRGLEEMIAAMQQLEAVEFWMAGEGDLSKELRQMAKELAVEDRVKFLGYIRPEELRKVTMQADLGVNLLKNKGLNYYYSLANKFFDYIQAEKPSLNMAFPEYQRIIGQYKVGLLLEDLEIKTIVETVQNLVNNREQFEIMKRQCRLAKEVFIWEKEEEHLLNFYESVFAQR